MTGCSRDAVTVSKFLSKVLRHNPGAAHVQLSPEGWAPIDELVQNTAGFRCPVTREMIDEIQRTSPKVRFEVSADGTQIRALHGHTLDIDLPAEIAVPPPILFHGTSRNAVPSIREQGLLPMRRQFVHLTTNERDAREVGRRHGKPRLLTIGTAQMVADGIVFKTSGNGIWLVDAVAPKYIQGLDQ
jgi:putative RNA 2'-phosphotransferase